MGTVDTKTKAFMSVNERFADFFNNVLYKGEEIILPEELKVQDVAEILALYEKGEEDSTQKYRDILKKIVVMKDNQFYYMFLGIENQTDYHMAMPVRNMLYDAIRYGNQVEAVARKNRKAGYKGMSSQEFLSGFRKNDRIFPVITTTLYWKNDEWDAPQKLSDMVGEMDERVRKYFNDYDINLIQPSDFESFESFQTDVGEVFAAIKVSKDKEQLVKLMNENEAYKNLELDAAILINKCTNSGLKIRRKKGGKVDMCKAIEDLKNDAKNEGRLETIADALKDSAEELVRKVLHATDEEISQAKELMMKNA